MKKLTILFVFLLSIVAAGCFYEEPNEVDGTEEPATVTVEGELTNACVYHLCTEGMAALPAPNGCGTLACVNPEAINNQCRCIPRQYTCPPNQICPLATTQIVVCELVGPGCTQYYELYSAE